MDTPRDAALSMLHKAICTSVFSCHNLGGYKEEQPRIDVRISVDAGECQAGAVPSCHRYEVRVSDTGTGVADEDILQSLIGVWLPSATGSFLTREQPSIRIRTTSQQDTAVRTYQLLRPHHGATATAFMARMEDIPKPSDAVFSGTEVVLRPLTSGISPQELFRAAAALVEQSLVVMRAPLFMSLTLVGPNPRMHGSRTTASPDEALQVLASQSYTVAGASDSGEGGGGGRVPRPIEVFRESMLRVYSARLGAGLYPLSIGTGAAETRQSTPGGGAPGGGGGPWVYHAGVVVTQAPHAPEEAMEEEAEEEGGQHTPVSTGTCTVHLVLAEHYFLSHGTAIQTLRAVAGDELFWREWGLTLTSAGLLEEEEEEVDNHGEGAVAPRSPVMPRCPPQWPGEGGGALDLVLRTRGWNGALEATIHRHLKPARSPAARLPTLLPVVNAKAEEQALCSALRSAMAIIKEQHRDCFLNDRDLQMRAWMKQVATSVSSIVSRSHNAHFQAAAFDLIARREGQGRCDSPLSVGDTATADRLVATIQAGMEAAEQASGLRRRRSGFIVARDEGVDNDEDSGGDTEPADSAYHDVAANDIEGKSEQDDTADSFWEF
eukprot:jgi/Mesvir1/24932/Mv16910-RA.1